MQRTKLLESIAENNISAVREIIKSGTNPNYQYFYKNYNPMKPWEANMIMYADQGDTPLIMAIKHGNLDLIKALIENGANVNLRNEQNDPPLTFAKNYHSIVGNKIIENYLLQNGAKDISEDDKVIQLIIDGKKSEVSDSIKSIGANIKYRGCQSLSNNQIPIGTPAITLAAIYENLDIVQILLEKGADPNCSGGPLRGLVTPLVCATNPKEMHSINPKMKLNKDIIAQLVKSGANVKTANTFASPVTSVIFAYLEDKKQGKSQDVLNAYLDVAKILLEKTSKEELNEESPFLLSMALSANDLELNLLLKSIGFDIDLSKLRKEDYEVALERVIFDENIQFIEKLILRDINLNGWKLYYILRDLNNKLNAINKLEVDHGITRKRKLVKNIILDLIFKNTDKEKSVTLERSIDDGNLAIVTYLLGKGIKLTDDSLRNALVEINSKLNQPLEVEKKQQLSEIKKLLITQQLNSLVKNNFIHLNKSDKKATLALENYTKNSANSSHSSQVRTEGEYTDGGKFNLLGQSEQEFPGPWNTKTQIKVSIKENLEVPNLDAKDYYGLQTQVEISAKGGIRERTLKKDEPSTGAISYTSKVQYQIPQCQQGECASKVSISRIYKDDNVIVKVNGEPIGNNADFDRTLNSITIEYTFKNDISQVGEFSEPANVSNSGGIHVVFNNSILSKEINQIVNQNLDIASRMQSYFVLKNISHQIDLGGLDSFTLKDKMTVRKIVSEKLREKNLPYLMEVIKKNIDLIKSSSIPETSKNLSKFLHEQVNKDEIIHELETIKKSDKNIDEITVLSLELLIEKVKSSPDNQVIFNLVNSFLEKRKLEYNLEILEYQSHLAEMSLYVRDGSVENFLKENNIQAITDLQIL